MKDIKEIKKFENLGESLRSIARKTGHCFETVKKKCELEDLNEILKQTRVRTDPKKIDTVSEIIDGWLKEDMQMPRKQRHTAKRIFDRLKVEYGELYAGRLRTIEKYVKAKKAELYLKKEECYLRLDHKGGEAQADFGTAIVSANGKVVTASYFALSFPYSNAGFCIAFKGQNQECLLEGLKRIFEHIGGVPSKIWFDNLSAAVIAIGKNRDRKLVEQFERFAMHYGFEHNFCNPGKGNEKGHVENKVGYDRRNFFVPMPKVRDFNELNNQLMTLCEKDMERPHYKLERKISELFAQEQTQFKKLVKKPFDVYRYERRITNGNGYVSYETNTYSTAPEYANKEIMLKATAEEIIIFNGKYEQITSHLRIYEKKKESVDWLLYIPQIIKRPKALKYTGFYNELPAEWKELFEKCGEEESKKLLETLYFMIVHDGIEMALKALLEAKEKGRADRETILAVYYRLVNKTPVPTDIKLPQWVPQLNFEWPKANIYDALLEGSAVL